MVDGLGFGVWGLGFTSSPGLKVCIKLDMIYGLGFGVYGLGFRVSKYVSH